MLLVIIYHSNGEQWPSRRLNAVVFMFSLDMSWKPVFFFLSPYINIMEIENGYSNIKCKNEMAMKKMHVNHVSCAMWYYSTPVN